MLLREDVRNHLFPSPQQYNGLLPNSNSVLLMFTPLIKKKYQSIIKNQTINSNSIIFYKFIQGYIIIYLLSTSTRGLILSRSHKTLKASVYILCVNVSKSRTLKAKNHNQHSLFKFFWVSYNCTYLSQGALQPAIHIKSVVMQSGS